MDSTTLTLTDMEMWEEFQHSAPIPLKSFCTKPKKELYSLGHDSIPIISKTAFENSSQILERYKAYSFPLQVWKKYVCYHEDCPLEFLVWKYAREHMEKSHGIHKPKHKRSVTKNYALKPPKPPKPPKKSKRPPEVRKAKKQIYDKNKERNRLRKIEQQRVQKQRDEVQVRRNIEKFKKAQADIQKRVLSDEGRAFLDKL